MTGFDKWVKVTLLDFPGEINPLLKRKCSVFPDIFGIKLGSHCYFVLVNMEYNIETCIRCNVNVKYDLNVI